MNAYESHDGSVYQCQKQDPEMSELGLGIGLAESRLVDWEEDMVSSFRQSALSTAY